VFRFAGPYEAELAARVARTWAYYWDDEFDAEAGVLAAIIYKVGRVLGYMGVWTGDHQPKA
jgi:hypothetical protein